MMPEREIDAHNWADEEQDLAISIDSGDEDHSTFEEMVGQVTAGLHLFALAVKTSGLYPANSAIRQEAMAKSCGWMGEFLERQEYLRLFVDPDVLLFQGRVVFQDKPGEPSLTFPLFRDGLQWIEFNDGLSRDELETFIGLLNRYRILKDDDENDLVTAMWAADLQFVKYKTANDFWDIDPITEITALTAGPGMTPSFGHTLGEEAGGGQAGVSALMELAEGASKRSVPNLPGREDLSTGAGAFSDGTDEKGELVFRQGLELKDNERRSLFDMASPSRLHEDLITSISPAIDLLWRLRTLEQARPILSFLAESLRFGLSQGYFQDLVLLHARLKLLAGKALPRLAGLSEEIDSIAGSEHVLMGLASYRRDENDPIPAERFAALETFLGKLPENSIKAMAVAAAETADASAATALLRAMAARSRAVTPELGHFINVALKPHLLHELISHLKAYLDAGYGTEFMVTLSRHVAPQVREAASLALLDSNPTLITALTHLLAEPEPNLNRRIYACLGTKRNVKVEKAILGFLLSSKQGGITRSEESLLNAYKALGLSASTPAASEFCLEIASRKGAKALLGIESEQDKAHRHGAVLALLLMGQSDSVASMGRSFFKDLRRAVHNAEADVEKIRRTGVSI